jgi:hypothetical protein
LPVGHAASCEALSVAMGSLFEERGGAASGLLSFTQSCEPQSVSICPQHDVSVLKSFVEAALINF